MHLKINNGGALGYIIHNGWLCKRPKYEEERYCLLLKWQWVCLRVSFCVIVTTCVYCHVLTCVRHIFFCMCLNISRMEHVN